MGWERKRGKLEELNRLLRGAKDTTFARHVGDVDGLAGVSFVITVDADTQLPMGTARRLVGLAESSHRDQSDRSVRYCKLVVDPEFRRQGIGAALLTELLDIDRGTPKYRSRRPPRTNGRRAWLTWPNSASRISNPKSACAARDLAFDRL